MSLAIRPEKLGGWTSYLNQTGRDGALSTQVCVLRRSVSINPERFGDGIWRLALPSSLRDLLANFNPELWTPDLDAVGLCAGHTGLCSLTDLLRLQFRQ